MNSIGTRDKRWGLSNRTPMVRIYAPLTQPNPSQGDQNPISEGPAATWPNSVVGPNGELPEYVVRDTRPDGKLTWVAFDPIKDRDRGICRRARIDVELVVDGKTVDLNLTKLPRELTIVDRRFDAENDGLRQDN